MENKIVYYSDDINDDFAGTNIKTKQISDNFKYIHKNIFYRFFAFLLYYVVAKPIVFIYVKIAFHHKFINKKVLKKAKNTGYYIYGNHTLLAMDAFIPNLLQGKRNFIIVGPDAFSIKGLSTIVGMLGGIPIPNKSKISLANYLNCLKYQIDCRNHICIYPEAHVWPYYTKIRHFKSSSFRYPYDNKVPVFCFTNIYLKSKNKLRKKPIVKTFVDGPFYFNHNMERFDSINNMRDRIYETMVKRSNQFKQYEYKFTYVKK